MIFRKLAGCDNWEDIDRQHLNRRTWESHTLLIAA
jgi:hypothetical protein